MRFILALTTLAALTGCICTYCCDTSVPPEEAVSVHLTSGSDSIRPAEFLWNLSVIAESESRLDTIEVTAQGQYPDRIGFRRYLGNPDSVTLHVMYRDSLVFTSTYLTPKSLDMFHVIRFSTDSAIHCDGKQAVTVDSGATLFICKQTGGVACL
jgi:hypothetical protein